MLSRLLTILSLSGGLFSIHQVRKFAVSTAEIVALLIVAAVISGALAILGLYEFYLFMVRHNIDPDLALALTVLLILLLLGMIVARVIFKMRQIHSMPLSLSSLGATGIVSLQSIIRGFRRGFKDD